ncbi:uncharacterized protein LOC128665001 [Bombina bombina]|uniref:uncharacterized protein LOC128665001 n=1 Tax=Bombina bombina TaxID=8345 RepID=UPI00235ADDF9|nr:uncharacterized protein LOC128665001 [Bombina bombina]
MHTSSQWDYQSIRTSVPSAAVGRAPPTEIHRPAPPAEIPGPAPPAEIPGPAPPAEDQEMEPVPIVPAGEEPMDPLTSAMGDEYISLQRRQTLTCESLTSTCERMQRDQRRFHRSQQRLQQRSIELQRDMAASVTAMLQNQSQMLRVISDMQIQSDHRWREQNQLLGVLVEHFTHQQDIASSISSVTSTPTGSTQPRRGRRPTPGPSAPSSKRPKRK